MKRKAILFCIISIILFSCKEDDNGDLIPTIDNPAVLKDTIILNPTGYSPLTAISFHSTTQNTRVELIIKSENPTISDFSHNFNDFKKDHEIPIFGLYPNYNNIVYLNYYNQGNDLVDQQIHIIGTEPINFTEPIIEVDVVNQAEMEKGMTLVSYKAAINPNVPFIFDNVGKIRWYLDYTTHPELATLAYDVGVERLKNGNFYFADNVSAKVYEVDMFGEVKNTWDFAGYDFHHNVYERENGNFLMTVDKPGSKHLNGNGTVEDFVIEINRNTGSIKEYDLRQSLDENRVVLKNYLAVDPVDWFHGNAVIESFDKADIIVSGRTQGYVKLSPSNKPKWIISPHKGWDTSRTGVNLNQFLLTPLDASNQAITDTNVLMGNMSHPDFEWPWYGHAPSFLPNGNIIVFDNGDNRHYTYLEKYSRAVEYEIDEQNMTIKQVWSYGKSRGLETHSRVVSDVDYLPFSDNVLFSPGYDVDNGNGTGGKIIEIDYASKSVVFEARITVSGIIALHRAERMPLYTN